MRKLVFNDSFDYPEAEHLVRIVDDPDDRRKIASAVTDSWGEVEPVKNHTLIHLIALGAFEKTGNNVNGDGFEEETCRKSHPTFVRKANLYRHHNSKIPREQRDGDVIKSAYNEKMGRVELLVAANNDKCADWLGKLEKGGEAKFSMGWHCFAPGSIVHTIDGLKKIEDIVEGDLVLTHDGSLRPVLKRWDNPLGDRRLVEIKCQTRSEFFAVTEDHELLSIARSDLYSDQFRRKRDVSGVIPEWRAASDIKVGDFLVRPIIPITGKNPIDNGVAYLLGQFLGDGCISSWTNDSIAITTHIHDRDILNKMVSICLEQQWNFSIDNLATKETNRKKNATQLRIREPEFTRLCEEFCGRTSSKYLRHSAWDWSIENMLNFIGGYIDADGSFDERSGTLRTCTVLDDLANSMQQAFFSVGSPACLHRDWFGLRENGSAFNNKREFSWILSAGKNASSLFAGYSVKVFDASTKVGKPSSAVFFGHDGVNYLAVPVKEIRGSDNKTSIVHCLTVDGNHSFTVSGVIVHNCDHDICSICGNKASKADEYCRCLKRGAAPPFGRNRILPDGRKCYMINREGYWNDISYVDRGADMIAMDLAKVAGLDTSEPLSGVELAEFMEGRILSTPKLAIAEKLSKIQKYIDAVGIKPGKDRADLSESAVRELQEKKPAEMFGAVAKAAALLPFSQFVKLSSGSMYKDFETLAKEAEESLPECIRLELGSPASVEAIASIHDFDPETSRPVSLTAKTASELSKFSVAPQVQEEKIKLATLEQPVLQTKTRPGKQARALVRQYLAYKVAFLAQADADDEMLFNALVLN